MSLPIDRTAKSALDGNLVNGNISDAPVIKNSNDTVYNTIDELYNYSQGLINAGILTQASKTPVANKIAQYDANANVVSKLPVSNGQNANLLFNPSFRLGSNGWTGIGSNGFATPWGQNGEGGFLFNNASTTASAVSAQSTKIPVAASLQLTVSGELYTAGVTAGSIQLIVQAFNSSDVSLGQVGVITPTNGQQWAKSSVTFTTPANTSYLLVFCYIPPNTTNTGAGWRKLKVESGPVATIFSDDNTLNTQQYGSALGLAQILSGGYKEQSGQSSITTSAAAGVYSVTVTFPIAFGTVPIVIPATATTSPNIIQAATVGSITATSCVISVNQTDAVARTVSVFYDAKGN